MNDLKLRNNSIDIFRYIFAIMVVAIHTEPIFYMSDAVYFVGFEILAKLAVPFFFAVAGYFYIEKLIKGEKIFLNYIKKLIFVYSIWTVFYYLKDLLLCILKDEPLDEFFRNCISNYFIYGSSFQFWFFPALIFSVCFTTLIYKLKLLKIFIPITIIFYLLGCFVNIYSNLGLDIPVVSTFISFLNLYVVKKFVIAALPFFFLGYIIILIKDKFTNIKFNKKILIILSILILVVIEYTVTRIVDVDLYITIYSILFILILMLLSYPMPRFKRTSSACRVLANFTYYSHGLFMSLINLALEDILNLYINSDVWFITTLVTTGLCGFVLYKINNRYLNKLVG